MAAREANRDFPQAELKNPFHTESGQPWLRKSWVVFLDVLGFSALVRRSAKDGSQPDLLNKLMAALNEAREVLERDNKRRSDFGLEYASHLVKFFTDNIVLGFPVADDGESELGQLIFITALYQVTLIKHGFFTRGGIGFGDLYMDEQTVFGESLLDAYEAESTLARDPRIVFSKNARDQLLSHLAYYGAVSGSPHNREVLVDSDSQLFINYLALPTDGMQTLSQEFLDLLRLHRDLITGQLRAFAEDSKVRPKYEWAAIYHNHVVGGFYKLADTYKVSADLILSAPRPLSAVYRRNGSHILKGKEQVATFKSMFEYERLRRPK